MYLPYWCTLKHAIMAWGSAMALDYLLALIYLIHQLTVTTTKGYHLSDGSFYTENQVIPLVLVSFLHFCLHIWMELNFLKKQWDKMDKSLVVFPCSLEKKQKKCSLICSFKGSAWNRKFPYHEKESTKLNLFRRTNPKEPIPSSSTKDVLTSSHLLISCFTSTFWFIHTLKHM